MRASELIKRRAARLASLLGIEHAIVGGPMAGVNTPELVAAVSNAGGLGSIGCGMMEPPAIEAEIGCIRELTDRPFAVNLIIAPPPAVDEAQILRMQAKLARSRTELGLPRAKLPAAFAPDFTEQFDAVLAARVPVFSFRHPGPLRLMDTACTPDAGASFHTAVVFDRPCARNDRTFIARSGSCLTDPEAPTIQLGL